MASRQELLKGVIDIHIHSGPDVRTRRLDDLELAAEARRVGARAIVIKSHVVPTMDRAWIAERATPGVRVLGGVVLNPQVGGLNPAAVETALKMGARIVWLPTSWADNERRRQGRNDGVVAVADGRIVPTLASILDMVAEAGVALATGHLAPEESLVVAPEALRRGVRHVIVNHPEWTSVNMSLETQRQLQGEGVFFERCYARHTGGGYEKNLPRNLEAIAALGSASTIIATDGGQVENPPWAEALAETIGGLLDAGISQAEVDRMTKRNPALVLGLD